MAGDDVPNKKPDPSIYKIAAERLQVDPAECLVIEDSTIGLQVVTIPGKVPLSLLHGISSLCICLYLRLQPHGTDTSRNCRDFVMSCAKKLKAFISILSQPSAYPWGKSAFPTDRDQKGTKALPIPS